MAKIKFGAVVADARGKVDGIVYSRNQYGAYIREKVTPVNPATPGQTAVRNAMANLATTFSNTLTDAQRLGWKTFSENFPVTDVFGNSQVLSPIASFQRVNVLRLLASLSILLVAPGNQNVTDAITMAITWDVGLGSAAATYTGTPLAANHRLIIYATGVLPPGVTFFRPRLRRISIGAAAAASPFDFESAWVAIFGTAPGAGEKVGFETLIWNDANGARAARRSELITTIST